jgi:xanthine dehydrogenase molybdenum-binding subunit
MPKLVGTDYAPPDLVAKITGRARFAEDFRAEGMLFAKCLLSPMPHARVRSVDAREALAMDGVEAILTADDLPGDDPLDEGCLTNEPLYEGQPILAVAAVNETLAADAIERIRVDLEPLPFALDPLDSVRPGGPDARTDGNTVVRERTEEGVSTVVKSLKWTREDFAAAGPDQLPLGEHQDEWVKGDPDAAFAAADLVLEETLYHQSVTHHPMEPRSCMAYWQNGKLYIHPSTQSVARTPGVVAAQVGIDPADVVLINEYTGGGFGSKIVGSVNMAIPALLARKTGRPVLHRVTRYEENYIGRARAGFYARLKMGFEKDGRVAAIDLFILQDNGPYGRQGDMSTAARVASLAYQPEAMRYRGTSVLTNTPPRSAQRAPGGAQIVAMVEPMVDRAAKQLGLDRIAIRRLNAPANGATFDGPPRERTLTTAYVREALDKTAELVDWEELEKLSGRRRGSKVTGVGIALSPYTAGSFGYDGLLVIKPDGTLRIHSGVGNLGTHSYSDTARVAADVLEVPWERCEVIWGNTGKHLPWTTIQAGSMTTHATTRAVHAAAMDARRKLQEIAARDLGGSPEQYEVGGERVFRRGGSATGMTLARAAARAIELGGKYDGHEASEDLHAMTKAGVAALAGQGLVAAGKDTYERAGDVYSFVVGCAQVEIDTETGDLEIVKYAAVTDCGTVLNPRSLAAQLHGGAVQGFGLARSQKWIFDPQWGVPFANRFYTARPPSILDVPLEMEWAALDLPDPNTPVGAKGIGEPPIGAGEGALICAIQDALGDAVFRRTPIMTDMILDAVEKRPRDFDELVAHV